MCEECLLSSSMGSLCHITNTMIYVVSWRLCAHSSVILMRGNIHQNNLLAHKQFAILPQTLFAAYVYNFLQLFTCANY